MKLNKNKKSEVSSLIATLQDNIPSLVIGFFIFILFVTLITRFISMYKENNIRKVGMIQTLDQKNNKTHTSPKKADSVMLKQTGTTMPKNQNYTVKEGDNLSLISLEYFNSEDYTEDIVAENNIENPDILSVGQVLVIPAVDLNKNGEIASGVQTSQVTIKNDIYTVKPGDNLWTIAEEAYGDGMMWTQLATANNIDNPDILNEGTSLKIPHDKTNLQTFVMPSF